MTIVSEQTEAHLFTIEAGLKVQCKKAQFEGTMTKTAQKTVEVTPKYSECTAFGFEATVNMGSCKYKFQEPFASGPFKGETSILCKAGEPAKVTAGTCEVQFGEQGPKKTITYENQATSPATVRVEVVLEKLKYNKTKDGIFCPLNGTGEKEDGTYFGNSKAEGRKEATQVGFAVGEVPASYEKEESYGLGNPAEPNVLKACPGSSIDCATGNLVEEQTDHALNGRGPALAITRAYNSQAAAAAKEAGPFGYGWSGPYSAHLTINKQAETATVTQDNGSTVVFYTYEAKYRPASWVQATLAQEGENYIYTLPSQEKLKFDSAGKLTEEKDRNGNALTLSYTESKLKTVKDGAGRELTFTYTGSQVESIEDPMGHKVKYTYESSNLATVTLPGEEKARWKFKYDGSRRLTELTDARGNTLKEEYDEKGRVKLQTDPLERKTKFEYGEAGGVKETTITEPNGSTTLIKSNAAGEPTETIRAKGTGLEQKTTSEYTKAYALKSTTDPNKHTTTYEYDAEGNLTLEKDAEGNESKWTYNSTHDVKTETTPKNETTTINRDKKGNVELIERPAPGATTQKISFKHAENGDLESETDPLERQTKYEYDTYGDRKAETNAAGDKTTWTYDKDGQAITEVTPRGNEEGAKPSEFETKTDRDAQGRPIKITDPLGHETTYKYDGNGNLESTTDAKEHTTKYTYNADNERTKVERANETTTETAYDSEGQVESKTNGNGKTTKYEHNSLGELTETIDPLERETIREYDAAGNLEKLKDPENRTTTYTYDKADRLTKVDYSEEATADVSYEYNKDSQVTVMKDGTGTSKYTYDELDRLTETENGNKEVVKYEYNLGEETTKITYPNGKTVTQDFDKAGRLEKATDWLKGETTFTYNRDSELKATIFPSATTNEDTNEYNRADELTKTTMAKGKETLASLSYTRSKLGQLESWTTKGLPGKETTEYGYDNADRLTKGGATEYKYDKAGNPTKIGATEYKYDAASQLEKGGTTTYSFDEMGERTKASPEGGSATSYGYDQAGKLISVKRETPEIKDTYAYDGDGRRASETVNGTTTHMAWDVAAGLLLYDGTNYYLYGPDGAPFEQITSETPTYLHHDSQGSTRLLTGSAGTTQGSYTYTPYGETEEHTGSATTPLGYDGQYTSKDTGLIYLRARVYDPGTAQFMSVDPLVDSTGETYGYAGQNPVNVGDPGGEQPPSWMQPPSWLPQHPSMYRLGEGWYGFIYNNRVHYTDLVACYAQSGNSWVRVPCPPDPDVPSLPPIQIPRPSGADPDVPSLPPIQIPRPANAPPSQVQRPGQMPGPGFRVNVNVQGDQQGVRGSVDVSGPRGGYFQGQWYFPGRGFQGYSSQATPRRGLFGRRWRR